MTGWIANTRTREHEKGEANVRELQHLLVAWKFICEARRGAFEGACPRYVKFYLEHMRLEETLILPAAERCLGADESSELDEAFASNRDPPTRRFTPDPSYERLFAHILLKAPTPIGVGEDV